MGYASKETLLQFLKRNYPIDRFDGILFGTNVVFSIEHHIWIYLNSKDRFGCAFYRRTGKNPQVQTFFFSQDTDSLLGTNILKACMQEL